MNTVSLTEFSSSQNLIFNQVKKSGTPIIITSKGICIAEIHPPGIPEKKQRNFGCMKETLKIVGDIISPASDGNAILANR